MHCRSAWTLFVAGAALLAAPSCLACSIVVPDVRTWSRDAVEIHEAVALSEHFEVFRTWRGPERQRLMLSRALERSLEFCTDQNRVETGQPYLLTVFCHATARRAGGPSVEVRRRMRLAALP